MNKQDLTNKTQLDAKTLSTILDAANIPNDLNEYTDEHFEVIRSLQEIRKDKKIQTWPEAFAIYIKPIRQTQLQEIAVRHAIAHDRISEILTGMKLKVETITDAQLELFNDVCKNLHAGIAFEMAVQSVAQPKQTKGKNANAQGLPEFAPQSEGEDVGGAIALSDNPFPEVVLGKDTMTATAKILKGTGLMEALEQDAETHADGLAESVARAPFDGVSRRAVQIVQQAEAAKVYGAQILDAKVTGKLNDPGFINRIVDDIKKKREASK